MSHVFIPMGKVSYFQVTQLNWVLCVAFMFCLVTLTGCRLIDSFTALTY